MHHERQNQTFELAEHVFEQGWPAVWMPKTSFSLRGDEAEPFTIAHQQVPMHGLLGWPLARLTHHDHAAVVIISLLFSVLSIKVMYGILKLWLSPGSALGGTVLWATAPLALHLGQVPMPDILCTTGIMASFLCAMRGGLFDSSLWFLFAILTKASVIVFGLPILVALLVARNCRSVGRFLALSLLWGTVPLAGLVGWIALEAHIPHTVWTLIGSMTHPQVNSSAPSIFSFKFYFLLVGCLIPFGIGMVGGVALIFAPQSTAGRIRPWIKWAIVISSAVYLFSVVSKVAEPQYYLPLLAWAVVPASFGLAPMLTWFQCRASGRLLGLLLALHVVIAFFLTRDLKQPRVPDFAQIQEAAALLPVGARVVVVYRYYGASACVWLQRNVLAVSDATELEAALAHKPALRDLGFTHLMIIDLATHHGAFLRLNLATYLANGFRWALGKSASGPQMLSNEALPSSPTRQYCDPRFPRLFEGDHVVLYQLRS